ncbi:hypothetical protein LN042_29555 [Kitasatospora sp. RB6PN24]|uniref:hypothetical protein n=1 Tax=Kitasatospora humi TaxID=2893891 RepID=UPI001E43C7D5|nr:hypothetical protein [Kitasatospora humi]MCC9311160.1 hypothetical protein [Kitasatospora humi]
MRQGLRQYMELAAGLAEEAGKRVVGTATELLDRAGVDVVAAERTVATLAQEVVTASRGGIDLAVGLARTEAEKAVERVSRLGDQVVKVGVVLEYLEGKLRSLEEGGEPSAAPPSSSTSERGPVGGVGRAGGLFADDWAPEQEREREAGGAEREPEPLHAQGAPVTPAAETTETAEAVGTAGTPETPETLERTAPAKRTVAKRTAAEKTTTARAIAKATATKKATAAGRPVTAKKTAAKKSPAKKAAAKKAIETVHQATVEKAEAKESPAKKTTAKKTAARKTAAKKAAPKRPETGETDV